MQLDNNWFTEKSEDSGIAFSLLLKNKIHQEQSPYQKIEIYETESFGTLMVIDDCIMLTDRDNFIYHEMMAHIPLFTHPNPRNVVIIGGGDCGTLQEALKHKNVEHVTQIDIDERVTRLAELYFPQLCTANNDQRATLLFADGIQWVADAADKSVDVIIVDSTDPVGPAVGLFKEPFYQDCRRILREDGVVIQQSGSPLIHTDLIAAITKTAANVGFNHVKTLSFPQCVYPTGWWSATIAYKGQVIPEVRLAGADLATQYYNVDIHRQAFALPQFLKNALK